MYVSMYNCHRRHISTHPHIRTYTYTHAGSAMFAALDSSSTSLYNTIYRMSHLFLYYLFNTEYNDNNNVSAMNNSYI